MAARISTLDGARSQGVDCAWDKVIEFPNFTVFRYRGTNSEIRSLTLDLHSSELALCASLQGMIVSTTGAGTYDRVIPESTFTLLRGPVQIGVCTARGQHDHVFIIWNRAETAALARWIDTFGFQRGQSPEEGIALSRPMGAFRYKTAERLVRLLDSPTREAEPKFLAHAHEIAEKVINGTNGRGLAAPCSAPASIKDLLVQVHANPHKAWPLAEAAERAGYSVYHFSRLFKATFGHGFPDYVDKRRCEIATARILAGASTVEDTVGAVGFSSLRAMRSAMKEYVGLLPSEVKKLATEGTALSSRYAVTLDAGF